MRPIQLGGVIPANLMPFRDDYAIDEAAYRRHLEWLLGVEGVGGVTCNGHAAEVATLSRDERRRAVAIAVEVAAQRVPVIAGIYAEGARDAVELARDAAREGADALLLFPLNTLVFGGTDEMVYRHFAAVAEAVDLPIVLFLYPAWTRMQYAPALLERLLHEIPHIVAIKEWSLDLNVYERTLGLVRSLTRPVSLLSSFSTHLLPSLLIGADGILSGHGSVVADLHASIWRHVQAGEWDAARRVYGRLQELTRAVYREPFAQMYARMKAQLVMLGRLPRAVSRPPILPVAADEERSLREALVRAGLMEAVVAPHAP